MTTWWCWSRGAGSRCMKLLRNEIITRYGLCMGLEIGTLHVRRSIFINAAPEAVWQHFATFEGICGWLDHGHTVHQFEPKVGGTVDMSVEIDGEPRHYGGPVLVFETGSEVSFESQWEGDRAWPMPSFWTIRLTSLYGGTSVELFHHGFERMGAEAADQLEGYEGGWGINHLQALRSLVES